MSLGGGGGFFPSQASGKKKAPITTQLLCLIQAGNNVSYQNLLATAGNNVSYKTNQVSIYVAGWWWGLFSLASFGNEKSPHHYPAPLLATSWQQR